MPSTREGASWRGTETLDSNQVEIVWAALDDPALDPAAFAAVLSPDEEVRRARFVFEKHRRRFTLARGLLRAVLAECEGARPREIGFACGPQGKPQLDGGSSLRFNVSHSEEVVVVALARGGEVGVDVEALRPMPDATAVARRFFSPAENAALAQIAEPLREAAFFACWTRKEAYLKTTGTGLAAPLDSFDVAFAPGEPPALLRSEGESDLSRWRMASFEPCLGYVGALVTTPPGILRGVFRLDAHRMQTLL